MVLEEEITKRLKRVVSDLADIVVFESQRRVSVDTGELKGSVEIEYPSEFEAIVRYDSPSAVWIEYGTEPHMPPVEPLERWARRHGMEGAGWAIAMKIKKEGVDEKPFLRPAVDIARARAPGVVQIHLNK